MRRAVSEDASARVPEFVRHRDQLGALNDLERERHIGGSWNAGHVTGRLGRICALTPLVVRFLLSESSGLIWNYAALNHTLPRRHTQRRVVILKVPRGRIQYLPDAVQIRLAVRRARNAAWPLRPDGNCQKQSS